MQEIVTLKLYTDFDKLQFALKKCFRFETIEDIIGNHYKKPYNEMSEEEKKQQADDIKQKQEINEKNRRDLMERLSQFYHWRGGLLIVLNKFGTKLNHQNDRVLFHGVNAKMIIKPSQTFAFSGPLSTTSSYHVARTFATAKGMVLKLTSHFPRLNYCNAFNVSLINDHPEKQEWIVGFIYLRLLEVTTTNIKARLDKIPYSLWKREQFFAMSLFNEQIFSMSKHLERILAQYLSTNRKECCANKDNIKYKQQSIAFGQNLDEQKMCQELCWYANHGNDTSRHDHLKILALLWKKFEQFRGKQRIKFDVVSNYLQRFFMEEIDQDIKEEKDQDAAKIKWTISFDEITTVYPYVQEIHFINNFKFDEHVLKRLIAQIKKDKEREKQQKINNNDDQKQNQENSKGIKKIAFLYYDYNKENDNNQPANPRIFKDPYLIEKEFPNEWKELLDLGWTIKHKKNGKAGYELRIFKKK